MAARRAWDDLTDEEKGEIRAMLDRAHVIAEELVGISHRLNEIELPENPRELAGDACGA